MLGNILDGYQDFSISTTAAEEQFYKVVTRNAFWSLGNRSWWLWVTWPATELAEWDRDGSFDDLNPVVWPRVYTVNHRPLCWRTQGMGHTSLWRDSDSRSFIFSSRGWMGVPFSLMVGIIAFTSSFCTLDRDALGVCISTWMLPLWLRDSWTHFLAVCGGSFLHLELPGLATHWW